MAATANPRSTARLTSGEGTSYAKWVAMAGLQFSRPAFRRASSGWLGGLRPADYYLSSLSDSATPRDTDQPGWQQRVVRGGQGRTRQQRNLDSGSFQAEQEQPSINIEHGLPSVVDVRRWSGSGQCVEAALREEVLEVSNTLMQWITTISKTTENATRWKAAGSIEEGDGKRARGGAGEIISSSLGTDPCRCLKIDMSALWTNRR